jgi:hypothetical protein
MIKLQEIYPAYRPKKVDTKSKRQTKKKKKKKEGQIVKKPIEINESDLIERFVTGSGKGNNINLVYGLIIMYVRWSKGE